MGSVLSMRVIAPCVLLVLTDGTSGQEYRPVKACSISGLNNIGLRPGALSGSSGDRLLDGRMQEELWNMSHEFGVLPSFMFLNDQDGPNAYTMPHVLVPAGRDGTVLFGAQLMQIELEQTRGQGFSVPAIIAHEFGHVVQYKKWNPLSTKRKEIQADWLAGWYLGRRAKTAPWNTNLQAAAMSFFSKGDYNFNDPSHHGTPRERTHALLNGFQNADLRIPAAYSKSYDYVT